MIPMDYLDELFLLGSPVYQIKLTIILSDRGFVNLRQTERSPKAIITK